MFAWLQHHHHIFILNLQVGKIEFELYIEYNNFFFTFLMCSPCLWRFTVLLITTQTYFNFRHDNELSRLSSPVRLSSSGRWIPTPTRGVPSCCRRLPPSAWDVPPTGGWIPSPTWSLPAPARCLSWPARAVSWCAFRWATVSGGWFPYVCIVLPYIIL